ncbi:MAG: abortive infection family protein [Pontimonas sp.]
MSSQLRDLIAEALYPIKAHTLPSVCERFGLAPGDEQEAMASKRVYVLKRLGGLSDEQVFNLAKNVTQEFPDDSLSHAIERIEDDGSLVSDITRRDLARALNKFKLEGTDHSQSILNKHFPVRGLNPPDERDWPDILGGISETFSRGREQTNESLLKHVGFMSCSQAKLFSFLEDLLHPIRRDRADQERIAGLLNPILRRDRYELVPTSEISGHPVYSVRRTTRPGERPSDELIMETLSSFSETGVHEVWTKALKRRAEDPEGAITAAKSLLETVCKHIIDEVGGEYTTNDDLPKLYFIAAEHLNLSPQQHSEKVFKSILGSSQTVVNNLSEIRNKLGDSRGQGKAHVKPKPRHAELAVNLAGSMATFLVATYLEVEGQKQSGAKN